jgi:protein-L-isoaspartate(D-aspartate) O-methyltransferase
MSINFEAAREQMIGQQVRTWEVLDERVLAVLRGTRRERFVPTEYHELAFADTEIPLGHGQVMMTPKLEGRLLQSLEIESIDDILEIGTGSGYLTACLAQLGSAVTSIDIYPEFVESAGKKLESERIRNADLNAADALTLRYRDEFDVIAVTASVPMLLNQFVEMLRPDGRMFIVIGRGPIMRAQLIRRLESSDWTSQTLFETVLTPMLNVDATEPFEL